MQVFFSMRLVLEMIGDVSDSTYVCSFLFWLSLNLSAPSPFPLLDYTKSFVSTLPMPYELDTHPKLQIR